MGAVLLGSCPEEGSEGGGMDRASLGISETGRQSGTTVTESLYSILPTH